jgi:hypothetical protein
MAAGKTTVCVVDEVVIRYLRANGVHLPLMATMLDERLSECLDSTGSVGSFLSRAQQRASE